MNPEPKASRPHDKDSMKGSATVDSIEGRELPYKTAVDTIRRAS